MNEKRICWYMFFLGLFVKTQLHLVGYIGVSELIVAFCAPFVFVRYYGAMKRDGMSTILNLAFMAIVGCVCSSLINGSSFSQVIRGFAQTYMTWAALVVGYYLLSGNIMSYRWFVLGGFLSGIFSIYFMQGAAVTAGGVHDVKGEAAVEMVKGSVLFWKNRILPAVNLPISMFYLQCPYLYSVIAPILLAIFGLVLSQGSGRGTFVVAMLSSALLAIGGKTRSRLARVRKYLLFYAILGMFALGGLKTVYSWAASTGRLGEHAERKYRDQTQRGTGVLSMLISGRVDFFVGLYACLQKPIVGHGPWPIDKEGYREYFLTKYGTAEDFKNVIAFSNIYARKGIPAHSHLVGYWLEYGILGLPFWLYVLWLFYRYLKQDLEVMPELFGWLILAIPSLAWSILFNPYAARVSIPIVVVALILIHARKNQMPYVGWRGR